MFTKILLSCLAMSVFFAVDAQQSSDMIQPHSCVKVKTADFHSAVDTVRDNWGSRCVCKGFSVSPKSDTGLVVEINYYKDPPDVWVTVAAPPGVPVGAIFRMIRSTNTTAQLDSIRVYPN